MIEYVEYFPPDQCEYCGTIAPLTEHHLIRRSIGGSNNKTIWLCLTCHTKATRNKKFEINLQEIFLEEI